MGHAYVPLDPTHPVQRKVRALRRLRCCLGCVIVGRDLWPEKKDHWLRAECARTGVKVIIVDDQGTVDIIQPEAENLSECIAQGASLILLSRSAKLTLAS